MISLLRNKLFPLFVVSLVAIGFEIALTRYFAIANWSEYGYWVISIAMVGFAVSGVVLSLFKDFFFKRSDLILFLTPPLLMVFGAAGFYFVTINPFNPLELQNPILWIDQVVNIGKYYVALFPFFFLAGSYIGLCFLTFQKDIPKIYAVDLVGAGGGALVVLVLMFWVHPFYLLASLLPLLLLVSLSHIPSQIRPVPTRLVVIALFIVCELVSVKFNRAQINEYKSIYPVLNVEGNKIVSAGKSPRGYFMVLDNFTERLDIDISNNIGLLNVSNPPETFGLYRDGNRVTSLPKNIDYDFSYVSASLDTGPYKLHASPKTLLIGTRGGFRIKEVLSLGASKIFALEPDSTIYRLIKKFSQGTSLEVQGLSNVAFLNQSPSELSAVGNDAFDIIDISSDFMDQSFSNRFSFTKEAIQDYYHMLSDDGLVSIPVSIREFMVYSLKMIKTTQQALLEMGISHPEDHIIVYRSAWNTRILISKKPFTPQQISKLKEFCNQLSFDISYFSGMNPDEIEVWNDLPLVNFEISQVVSPSDKASDALMTLTLELFGKSQTVYLTRLFFNLEPMTHDRPFFYYILKITRLDRVLSKISIIPREEIGYLINLAVLAQALVLAVFVLFLPLVRWRKSLPSLVAIEKSIIYFSCLGLGFLCLEIFIIDKASFYLNDSTYAFAVVLTGMLVFSGLGSYLSGQYLENSIKAVRISTIAVLVWITIAFFFLDGLLSVSLGLPLPFKCLVILLVVAPVSVCLGFPFPLGLYLFRGEKSNFLPWAWSLNGAFSVISTPLANLLAVSVGYKAVLLSAGLLYLIVFMVYPGSISQRKLE